MKKNIHLSILVSLFITFTGFTVDKTKKTETVKFHVAGVCGLCETTIERAVDVKGVVAADYTLETGILEVTFKPSKISEDQLHKLLNEVGYDTEKSKATDEQYNRVHDCCRYREMEKH
jgi:copper chaperone CopZ